VNGAGFRSHGTSSADEERNALRLTVPVARYSASRWPNAGPACADFDLALPFTLQPQPKGALSSRTPLTDFCNRKPKLEHAHERSSPRLRRAFHAKELRFESARAGRAGYPGGHAPVARGMPAYRPISCRASMVQGTGADSTTEPDTPVAGSGSITLEGNELVPELA
jgi:hypothetical protein